MYYPDSEEAATPIVVTVARNGDARLVGHSLAARIARMLESSADIANDVNHNTRGVPVVSILKYQALVPVSRRPIFDRPPAAAIAVPRKHRQRRASEREPGCLERHGQSRNRWVEADNPRRQLWKP